MKILVTFTFRCTNEGIYDTPGPNDPWPQCTPQQESKYLKQNTDFFKYKFVFCSGNIGCGTNVG